MYSFWIDKTRQNVLKYSDIAVNYKCKLIRERTWLESWIEALKVWSSYSKVYNQDKVALLASVVEGHLRPGEFLTAIISKSLVVEPVHLRLQRDQAAREVALAKSKVRGGQLNHLVDKIYGESMWG